jgi:hypothetical protein
VYSSDQKFYTHQITGGTKDTHEYIYCYNLVFVCCVPALLCHCFYLIRLNFKQLLLMFYGSCTSHICLIRFVAFNSIYTLFSLCFVSSFSLKHACTSWFPLYIDVSFQVICSVPC